MTAPIVGCVLFTKNMLAYAWIETCGGAAGESYIDSQSTNIDMAGRISYTLSADRFDWYIGSILSYIKLS